MKKRITAVLLCAVMIIPMFILSSCGGGGGSTYTQAVPYTVTLYSITDESTTEEGIEAAQKAINDFTETQYGTHVELKLYTADEYADVVGEKLDLMAADSGNAPITVEETSAEAEADDTAEETAEEEETKVYKKREDVKYPQAGENQVDILLVTDIDNFNTYCADGLLAPMNDYLASAGAIIYKYTHPILLQAGQYSTTGVQYAIPNNRLVGEYEYLLLNKNIIDSFGYAPEDIHTILQLNEFISDVVANAHDYKPCLDTYGVSTLTATVDGAGDFFGNYIGYGATGETNAMPKSLFSVGKFKNEFAALHALRKNGYMTTGEVLSSADAESAKYASMFVKGDINTPAAYEDNYYATVYKMPTATNTNLYDGMYAVSAYTKNLDRCMQILVALQTNEELRNIFQYGKEGEQYEVNKEGLVSKLTDDYTMNPSYTGNQFILTPNTEMSEAELKLAENSWELAKEQNKSLVKSPYCGYSAVTTYVEFDEPDTMTDSPTSAFEMLSNIKKLSDDYNKRIEEYNGAEGDAFIAFLETLGEEMKADKNVKNETKTVFKNSALSIYNAWYKAMYKSDETEAAPAATTTAAADSSAETTAQAN